MVNSFANSIVNQLTMVFTYFSLVSTLTTTHQQFGCTTFWLQLFHSFKSNSLLLTIQHIKPTVVAALLTVLAQLQITLFLPACLCRYGWQVIDQTRTQTNLTITLGTITLCGKKIQINQKKKKNKQPNLNNNKNKKTATAQRSIN